MDRSIKGHDKIITVNINEKTEKYIWIPKTAEEIEHSRINDDGQSGN
tara:strand:+ start:73 stop:213 length:141 start_codon:yes stop_codon:yes gene_type:complete